MATNWSSILGNRKNRSTVTSFAEGKTSGRDFYSAFANTSLGGDVRNLLRSHGVDRSRGLARKALSRRECV